MGSKCVISFSGPPKGTFLRETTSCDVLIVKIGAVGFSVGPRLARIKKTSRVRAGGRCLGRLDTCCLQALLTCLRRSFSCVLVETRRRLRSCMRVRDRLSIRPGPRDAVPTVFSDDVGGPRDSGPLRAGAAATRGRVADNGRWIRRAAGEDERRPRAEIQQQVDGIRRKRRPRC